MDDLRQELVELRAEMAQQQARIAELERRVADRSDPHPRDSVTNRRQLLVAAAAVVASGATAVSASPAQAANGQPLILGNSNNTASLPTGLLASSVHGLSVSDQPHSDFVISAAIAGVARSHLSAGVLGLDTRTSPIGGAAVYGHSLNGDAVVGLTSGAGARGVSGFSGSSTPDSIGVLAQSSGGTALAVDGILRARRTGVAVIETGRKTTFVALGGMTHTSLVFATPVLNAGSQAIAECRVRTTGNTGFFIKLTGAASGNVRVAWVVIDRIGSALTSDTVEAPSQTAVQHPRAPVEWKRRQ